MDRAAALCALLACALPSAAQDLVWSQPGGSPLARYGAHIARAGDLDGDGLPDLLVGAPGAASAGTDTGAAEARRGADGALLQAWAGAAAGDEFGVAVAAAGDVDGDGLDDALVGAYRNDSVFPNGGRAYVFSGASGAQLYVIDADGNGDDEFGIALAGIGDVTGDGVPDLAIGAHHDDVAGANSGSVRLCSGADGSTWLTIPGGEAFDDLGHAVDACGDVNLDGVPDLIAGSHDTPEVGEARVFSGVDGSELRHWLGSTPGDFFGHAVSGAGDVDGDGVPDLVIGAARDDSSATNAGRVILCSGATSAVLHEWFGEALNDQFGLWVDAAGDWNLDGVPDVAVGVPGDDDAGLGSGSARVFSGGGSELLHWDGASPGQRYDAIVAGLLDADGDGRIELAVSFPYDDGAGLDAGVVQVLRGPEAGPWTHLGGGLPGISGIPQLTGQGDLAPGTAGSLTLTGAAPLAPCALFFAFLAVDVPFKGGTLSAYPPLAIFYLASDGGGGLFLPWTDWTSLLPPGLELYFQLVFADAAAPKGASISNLLRGVTQP